MKRVFSEGFEPLLPLELRIVELEGERDGLLQSAASLLSQVEELKGDCNYVSERVTELEATLALLDGKGSMADFRELCTQPLREKIAELEADVERARSAGAEVARAELEEVRTMHGEDLLRLEPEVERLKKENKGLTIGLAMVVAKQMEEDG